MEVSIDFAATAKSEAASDLEEAQEEAQTHSLSLMAASGGQDRFPTGFCPEDFTRSQTGSEAIQEQRPLCSGKWQAELTSSFFLCTQASWESVLPADDHR